MILALQHRLPECNYQAPSASKIMDTGLTLWGLFQTGLSLENPIMQKGVEFLWSRQNSKFVDWIDQIGIPVDPGGWGFSLESENYPDMDDTAMMLLVLKDLYGDAWCERKDDFTKGMDWLLAISGVLAQVEIQIVPDGDSPIAKQDHLLSPDHLNCPWTAVFLFLIEIVIRSWLNGQMDV